MLFIWLGQADDWRNYRPEQLPILEERGTHAKGSSRRIWCFIGGFGAGIEQSLSDPLGKRGTEMCQWFFRTRSFRAMHGQEGGVVDTDDEFARKVLENSGAFILGRNMFGPVRGPRAGRLMEGLVGRQSSVPCPNLRSEALRAWAAGDGGRDDFLLC